MLWAASASARPVKVWSLKELHEKADLVIIGSALSSADAKNHEYRDAKADTWVSVDTVFNVDSRLKGDLTTDAITVRHHRYHNKSAEITTTDGPSFVEFHTRLKNQFLIFLKRTDSGLYEPLTGQYDPVDSFFMLQKYHVTKERPAEPGKPKMDAEQSAAGDVPKAAPEE